MEELRKILGLAAVLIFFVQIFGSRAAYAGNGQIEIIPDKNKYYLGEPVEFLVRGRIMLAKEADGKVIYPPFSIWDENMKRLALRHSCAQGVERAIDQYCQGGVVKEIEVARCPNAFFSDYEDINQRFSWDQKVYAVTEESCGAYTIHREAKTQVPPGKYRIVVCGSIQSCTEKEIIITAEPDVSVSVDKRAYNQGETVKITITNYLPRPLYNTDWSVSPIKTDYSQRSAGWGFVEKFKDGSWVRVEPLWRCGGECFSVCAMGNEFFSLQAQGIQEFPGYRRYFEWDQTKLICLPALTRKQSLPGRYRISCQFRDPAKNEIKTFHSNEFELK